MAHVFNYFTRLCRRHSGICPDFLALEVEEANLYLADLEELFQGVNMDQTGRTISVAFVVIFGLLLAFTVSALESYTGALFVGKFADNLVRIIYVLEELTLHLGLLLIFGSDYAIVILLQYLFRVGRWLLMLMTLMIAGLGQHVVTVLVAAMDERDLGAGIDNPTIWQQATDFMYRLFGLGIRR
jgi:hypothetical protein